MLQRTMLVLFTVALLSALPRRAHAADHVSWANWGYVYPASGWTVRAGNFNGDAMTDLVAYYENTGAFFVGISSGSSVTWTQWATAYPPSGWNLMVGEFHGDGAGDIAIHHPSNGAIFVGKNTGSAFAWDDWAAVPPGTGWSFLAGDFSGDGLTDLMAVDGQTAVSNHAILELYENTGSDTFDPTGIWYAVDPRDGWSFEVGDFTHDGLVDLFAYHPSNGTFWLATNEGSAFSFYKYRDEVVQPNGWRFVTGNFDGDGFADVVHVAPDTGPYNSHAMHLWRGAGDRLFHYEYDEPWGTLTEGTTTPWQLTSGDFTGEGKVDVAGYDPASGNIWIGTNHGLRPEGYAWPLSARPGETIEFMASGVAGTTAVRFLRHRATKDGVESVEWGTTTWLSPGVQPTPAEPWEEGCGWTTSFSLTLPDLPEDVWPSGVYSAELTSAMNDHSYITFIVKPAVTDQSSVAVITNINTWNAYNDWGRSKYRGAAHGSFLRPNPSASPIGEKFSNHHLTRAELWVITWLEDKGFQPDVYTDLDFHNGISGYDKIVIQTHPEYWTTAMYDNLKSFVEVEGKDVIYLAGNGLFEVVEYSPDQTSLTFSNGVEGASSVCPALFRVRDGGIRAERSLLGVQFTGLGDVSYPFVAETDFPDGGPAHWIWQGSAITAKGAEFGATGLNTKGGLVPQGGACGWEWDSASPANQPGCSPAPNPSLPPGHELLADNACSMTYYELPNGGSVFAMGSITVGGSQVIDEDIQHIVKNALDRP